MAALPLDAFAHAVCSKHFCLQLAALLALAPLVACGADPAVVLGLPRICLP